MADGLLLREMLEAVAVRRLPLAVGIAVVVVLGSWGMGNRELGTGGGSTLA
jgi:hypothetical protein